MRTASAASEAEADEAPAARAPGIAFLLDWSDLLRAAGLVSAKAPLVASAAEDEAMQDTTTGAQADDAPVPQPAQAVAAAPDIQDRKTATFVQMLLVVGAALLVAGAIWQAIFSFAGWLRDRTWHRRVQRRTRPLPSELQPRDLTAPPPANAPGRRPRQADPYGPFDPDELQRILDRLRSAA